MKFPNFFGSASSLLHRGNGRNKADVGDAVTPNYSEQDVALGQDEEGEGGAQEKGKYYPTLSVTRSFLAHRPRSPSPSASDNASTLPPSEYNTLDSRQESDWNRVRFRNRTFLRYSCSCWMITGIAIMLLSVILITVLVLKLTHKGSAAIDFTVDLGYSKYKGITAEDPTIAKWLGIRYAAPPLGDLRFRAPQPPANNATVIQANQHGPTCLPTPSTGLTGGSSEDCLFLDVMAPTDNSKSHPVFVYIQGGGFNTNSSPNMNGGGLIGAGDHDIVTVTFNYRVGPWGFLTSKEVQANGDLNVGLLDQRAVLEWVQKYIHLFGGDPKRVTIGGASAGAASVDLHLTAYGGRNDRLFVAAALESQSFGAQLTIAESQYQYDGLVNRTGCSNAADTLKCLRSLDVAVLAKNNAVTPTPGGAGGNPVFMYSNVIDGNFTQDYTYNMYAQGKFIKVPAIFGDATNEGTIFTHKNINHVNDVNNFLKNNFVKLTATQLAQIDIYYPKAESFPNAGDYWRTAANAYGEMRYNCPGIWLSSIFDAAGTRGWNYHWDVLGPSDAASGLGVTHTSESSSIWGTPMYAVNPMTPILQNYWASFIRSQDPNTYKAAEAPYWNHFNGVNMERVHFTGNASQVAMESVPSDMRDRCAYVSSIGGALGM